MNFLLETDTRSVHHHPLTTMAQTVTGQHGQSPFLSLSAAPPPLTWDHGSVRTQLLPMKCAVCYGARSSGRMVDAVPGGHVVGHPFSPLPIRLSWASGRSDSTLLRVKMSSWKFSVLMWLWAKLCRSSQLSLLMRKTMISFIEVSLLNHQEWNGVLPLVTHLLTWLKE